MKSEFKKSILVTLILILLTLGLYSQVATFDFVRFDDNEYIAENSRVQQGLSWENLKWAFGFSEEAIMYYYHPLTWVSFMMDAQIFGVDAGAHHLVNVIIHVINTVLLFLVLRWMTGTLWPSAFVAILFAVHPLNVESVAWIAERKNVLSTFFWMLCMVAYTAYASKPAIMRYILIFIPLALGLFTKPLLVTIPCVFLLMDFWPFRRCNLHWRNLCLSASNNLDHDIRERVFPKYSVRRLVIEKIPFLLFSLIFTFFSVFSLAFTGQIILKDDTSIVLRLSNTIVVYVKYILNLIMPHNMAFFYPFPTDIPVWQVVGAGFIIITITVGAFFLIKRAPYIIFGWFWYLGTSLPTIGFFQSGRWPEMADRYIYIPAIGIFIMVVWGAKSIIRKFNFPMYLSTGVAVTIVAAFMLTSANQISTWKNSEALFGHAIKATPNSPIAHLNYGYTIEDENRKLAIRHYKKAIALKPDYVKALNNLGAAYFEEGRINAAIAHYKKALAIEPFYLKAQQNLALVYYKAGRTDMAIKYYKQILEAKPNFTDAIFKLGNAYKRNGQIDKAISYYTRAIEIDPGLVDIRNNLAAALIEQGRFNEALGQLEKLLKIKPSINAHLNAGVVLTRLGRVDEAIAHYQKALSINPNIAVAHNLLGELQLQKNNYQEAKSHFETALELQPGYPTAAQNLKKIQLKINQQ